MRSVGNERKAIETNLFELEMAFLEVMVFVVVFLVVSLALYATRWLLWDRRRTHEDVVMRGQPVVWGRDGLMASGGHGGEGRRDERRLSGVWGRKGSEPGLEMTGSHELWTNTTPADEALQGAPSIQTYASQEPTLHFYSHPALSPRMKPLL